MRGKKKGEKRNKNERKKIDCCEHELKSKKEKIMKKRDREKE